MEPTPNAQSEEVQSCDSTENSEKILHFPKMNVAKNSDTKNEFFEETPDTYTPEEDKAKVGDVDLASHNENLKEFVDKASKLGCSKELLDRACTLAKDKDVNSYTDFQKLITQANQDIIREENEQKDFDAALREDTKRRVAQAMKITDLPAVIEKDLRHHYNTSCATVWDIISKADDDELNLDLYQRPDISVYLQIGSDWVHEIVDLIRESWEVDEHARKFVEDYLSGLGVDKEFWDQELENYIATLPTVYREEDSPLIYKQVVAVQLRSKALYKKDFDAIVDAVNKEADRQILFAAAMEDYIEQDVPVKLANNLAASETIDSIDERERDNLAIRAATGLGALYAGALNLKYNTSKSFEDTVRETLGVNADEWEAQRAERDARKAEVKEKRRERRELEKERRREERAIEKEERAEDRRIAREEKREERKIEREERREANRVNRNNARYNNRGYYNTRQSAGYGSYGNSSRNFAPKIPTWLAAGAVHAIVVLLVFALFRKGFKPIGVTIGLVAATVGMFKFSIKEQGAALVTVAGYAIALISLFLF